MRRTAAPARWRAARLPVLIGILIGMAGTSSCGLTAGGGGPLEIVGGEGSATGIGAAVGQQVSYGATRLRNPGDTAATLSSAGLVDFQGPDGAARVIQAGIYPLVNGEDLAAGYWPEQPGWPEEGLLPADGYVLEPGDEVSLFFVVEGAVEGAYGWRGVEVEYEIDGREHREEQANGFVVCVPRGRECPLRSALGYR